jgi:hypothetical protein
VGCAGDKAYGHEEELTGLRDPHVAIHGSFSFMVNFHAVKVYVANRGGFALQTPHLDGFKVRRGDAPRACVCVLSSADGTR